MSATAPEIVSEERTPGSSSHCRSGASASPTQGSAASPSERPKRASQASWKIFER